MTPEAVEALLADQDGVAWPIFVDGSRRSFQQAQSCKLQLLRSLWQQFVSQVNKWKWFPKQRRWMNLPSEASDGWFFKNRMLHLFFVACWNVWVWVLIGKMQCNTVRSIILDHQTLPDMTLAFWACRPRDDRCVTTISWIDAVKSCVRHSSSHRTVGNPKPSSLSLLCPPKTLAKSKGFSGFIRYQYQYMGQNTSTPRAD